MPRILIVDDEPGYRKHLSRELIGDGYDVETATRGREALEIARRFQPDVLIADWMLKTNLHGLEIGEA